MTESPPLSLEAGKSCHVFIAHNATDKDQVAKVVQLLEQVPDKLICCHGDRDFNKEESLTENILRCVATSSVTVPFLSLDFNDEIKEHDFDQNLKLLVDTVKAKTKLLPVLLQGCNLPDTITIPQLIKGPEANIVSEIKKCVRTSKLKFLEN